MELLTSLLLYVALPAGKFLFIAFAFTMVIAAVLTVLERRQSAYAQDRLGPSRAHFIKIFGHPFIFFGLFHVVADGMKMFFKEAFVPTTADKWIFRIAPIIGFAAVLVTMALIPFGPDITLFGDFVLQLQVVRVDTGVLLLFAIGSLGVYGAALGGWASNNRFGLLGGLRSAAQSISYEIALGLTIVGILIAYGSTELYALGIAQSGTFFYGILPNWGIFIQPLGAILFFTAAIAETKRAPFDMPEAESEILGYFVEYSSMGFGLFMLAEFLEIVALGALFTTLFLGGWQAPWIIGDGYVLGLPSADYQWLYGLVGFAVFAIKTIFMCLLQLQIRWTLPRFRYDQLMRIGWKNLLPLALVNIFITAGLVWWDPTNKLLLYVGITMIVLFIVVVIAGPRRVTAPAEAH